MAVKGSSVDRQAGGLSEELVFDGGARALGLEETIRHLQLYAGQWAPGGCPASPPKPGGRAAGLGRLDQFPEPTCQGICPQDNQGCSCFWPASVSLLIL